MTVEDEKVTIAIDRGGTFTDIIYNQSGKEGAFKILSVDPENYADANIEGIRRVLQIVEGKEIPRGVPLDTSRVSSIRLGTTVATNALLERKGARCALVTTKGFKDLLHIGDQSRPDLFALNIVKPGVLFDKVVEVNARVTMPAFMADPTGYDAQELLDGTKYVRGETGEIFEIVTPLNEEELTEQLMEIKNAGIDSIAIVFVHGYNFQVHEKRAGEIALKLGFDNVSLSHELLPVIKMITRGQSAVMDAYLTPVVAEYIRGFLSGFEPNFQEHTRIEFMQSDGGLCSHENFRGLRAILSGPAGGVVGLAKTSYDDDFQIPVIGFDMGGTSTDVSRYAGLYEFCFETSVAGIKLAAPQLDINTVAAGGGSMLFYRNGVFVVGPESAGAHPGPACYRKGGPLTITDANLFTGRIIPEFFPTIFGPNENEPLDFEITRKKFEELTNEINKENPGSRKTPLEVALGFLEVANYQMARPIRDLTDSKGNDVSKHILASFGGAGGQHAVGIAKILKIKQVIIHRHSSLLSAYGISLADIVVEEQEPVSKAYGPEALAELRDKLEALKLVAQSKLEGQGVASLNVGFSSFLNMGYTGSDTRLMIELQSGIDPLSQFYEQHQKEFAFNDFDRDVMVSDIRVRATGNTLGDSKERSPLKDLEVFEKRKASLDQVRASRPMCFQDRVHEANVYFLGDLVPGDVVEGPASILNETQTIIVSPLSTATILPRHVVIDLEVDLKVFVDNNAVDPIQLAIFSSRFMSIADDMSRTLQKISVSANIKERLDYSCALFDNQGNLCANAPNVPVHLGSMSSAIKFQLEYWGANLKEGDILCTNSPTVGGTHLPDITVISPVFIDGEIQFVVAARAHHSEIGGTTPGLSSSYARDIHEEGVNIEYWKIVSEGHFDNEGLIKHFVDTPRTWGVSGTRNLSDNIADLKAQIASNQRGINLIKELFKEYDTKTVLFYMKNVKRTAELAVRSFLKNYYRSHKDKLPLKAVDHMDDGCKIAVQIDILGDTGTVAIDFTGTSLESYSNLNAPKSTAYSAIIYVLRCMIDLDIPLNQGFLDACEINIPENTLINPSKYAAVCAGNGMTSQRVTDCLFKAFGLTSATGGCMNGINFGVGGELPNGEIVKGFGYTETVGQGNCAGIIEKNGVREGFHGFLGTQTNMTNTRITDPEVLEQRYPCFLHEYCIRKGSGGKGKFHGGDGLIREIEFQSEVHLSLVTQRRVYSPWGIYGGDDGEKGENYLGRNRGSGTIQWIQLPSLAEIKIKRGDIIRILTPGGGGFGQETDTDEFWNLTSEASTKKQIPLAGGSVSRLVEAANSSQ